MKNLVLRSEHLTDLTPEGLRAVVAAGPARDSDSCTCVTVICNLDATRTVHVHGDISVCCDN